VAAARSKHSLRKLGGHAAFVLLQNSLRMPTTMMSVSRLFAPMRGRATVG